LRSLVHKSDVLTTPLRYVRNAAKRSKIITNTTTTTTKKKKKKKVVLSHGNRAMPL